MGDGGGAAGGVLRLGTYEEDDQATWETLMLPWRDTRPNGGARKTNLRQLTEF